MIPSRGGEAKSCLILAKRSLPIVSLYSMPGHPGQRRDSIVGAFPANYEHFLLHAMQGTKVEMSTRVLPISSGNDLLSVCHNVRKMTQDSRDELREILFVGACRDQM